MKGIRYFVGAAIGTAFLLASPHDAAAQGGWCYKCSQHIMLDFCDEVEEGFGSTWCVIEWEGNRPVCYLVGGHCEVIIWENEDVHALLSADGTLLTGAYRSPGSGGPHGDEIESERWPHSLFVQERNCRGVVIGRLYGSETRRGLLHRAAVLTL